MPHRTPSLLLLAACAAPPAADGPAAFVDGQAPPAPTGLVASDLPTSGEQMTLQLELPRPRSGVLTYWAMEPGPLLAGQDQGPCLPGMRGDCLELRQPTFLGTSTSQLGVSELTFPVPTGTRVASFQAVVELPGQRYASEALEVALWQEGDRADNAFVVPPGGGVFSGDNELYQDDFSIDGPYQRDVFYTLVLPPGERVDASLVQTSGQNPAHWSLWFVDGTSPTPTVLALGDDARFEHATFWANTDTSPQTLWLVASSYYGSSYQLDVSFQPDPCGNGVIDEGEACDPDFPVDTCWDGVTSVSCSDRCELDLSACPTPLLVGETCADAIPLPSGHVRLHDDTVGYRADLEASPGCVGESTVGVDRFYAVDVPAGHTVEATVDTALGGQPADWSVWIVNNCARNTCLAGSQGTGVETASATNASTVDRTVYVVVDAAAHAVVGDYVLEVDVHP